MPLKGILAMKIVILTLIGLCILPKQVFADTDRGKIGKILNAIEEGWELADGSLFRKHFLDYDGARYIESGGQNVGLTDLIEHHVEPEGEALKLDLDFTNPVVKLEDDFAWVVVDTEVRATVYGTEQRIHNKGYQTVILRNIDGGWKVLHTHSSGRPVKKN